MNKPGAPTTLDRYTQLGELAENVRQILQRTLGLLGVLLGATVTYLALHGKPGAAALGLISIGTLVVFWVWRSRGIGLPLLPVLALQHLVAYGLPIAIGHSVVQDYPSEFLFSAGIEVFVFCCVLAGAWKFGMQIFRPAPAVSYALQGLNREGTGKLRRWGFSLIFVSTVYQLLQAMNGLGLVFALLPSGTASLLVALMSAAAACGFFIVAMFVGGKELSSGSRGIFWFLMVLNCLMGAAAYLLSPATTIVAAVLIGLFWARGRIPWQYLMVVLSILAFLNLGKYTMRDRYWHKTENDPMPTITLFQMPASYAEWIEVSYQAVTGKEEKNPGSTIEKSTKKGVSLFERINNLQNLLYVINATETWKIAPLGGKTYSLIPPLLLPRIFWPDKPRTHAGQVMLNVHFGRQALESTFETYIAWGLLAEAYGNFGSFWGALFLGVVLGIFCAWLENATARKLLLSLEGFIAFTILLGIASSYEMVASILVTSMFQAIVPLIIMSIPFVRRMSITRPAPAA
ncbi:MAG TPA: hypothetical protein VHO24_05825 [Opitutaceae bacterium]|nr:hypothetical protein [Opitutaceae bacterium]